MTSSKRTTIATVLIASLAIAVPALAQSGSGADDKLASTRETLDKWVETQQILSKEREDWEVGKDVLDQRISLVRGEIETLRAKIAEQREAISDSDKRRKEIVDENDDLRAASEVLGEAIGSLEHKTLSLVARLPDPIRTRVRPLSQKIPKDPAQTELSLGQRYQNVIGVLNEVNKFNRDITVTSELRALPDGSTVEVQALYVGLGQAYYVSPDGTAAGYGAPGEDGWEWIPADDLAPRVARVIKILQNEDVPAFVPLPVEIR